MGCAVACVASCSGSPTRRRSRSSRSRASRGRAATIAAKSWRPWRARRPHLPVRGLRWASASAGARPARHRRVRGARRKLYPAGHYFLRSQEEGWMNPWSNFPRIHPVESRLEPVLPVPPAYVILRRRAAWPRLPGPDQRVGVGMCVPPDRVRKLLHHRMLMASVSSYTDQFIEALLAVDRVVAREILGTASSRRRVSTRSFPLSSLQRSSGSVIIGPPAGLRSPRFI